MEGGLSISLFYHTLPFSTSYRASSRIAGLIGIAILTIVAIVVVVSVVLAFGYH